ncbi:MAG: phosphotransferase [Pseudomonadota bacterium]
MSELDTSRFEELATRYGLGELVCCRPAAAGTENRNYFLTTRTAAVERHFVLTLMDQPAHAGDVLVDLLDHCAAAGLPVPTVLRTTTGSPTSEMEGRTTLLAPRLPGWHVTNPTGEDVQAVGRFLARLHVTTADFAPALPDYPRDGAWLERGAAASRPRMSYRAASLMSDTVDRVRGALRRHDVNALPRGVIHGDLFRDNVLFNAWGLSGVVDFHHAARGFLIFDLAVAINDWCTGADGTLDPERAIAMLRAYHRLRPLTRGELWHFTVFALYAALVFWIARQAAAPGGRARDPGEFQRIVEHHTAHFLYLDERVLD